MLLGVGRRMRWSLIHVRDSDSVLPFQTLFAVYYFTTYFERRKKRAEQGGGVTVTEGQSFFSIEYLLKGSQSRLYTRP